MNNKEWKGQDPIKLGVNCKLQINAETNIDGLIRDTLRHVLSSIS